MHTAVNISLALLEQCVFALFLSIYVSLFSYSHSVYTDKVFVEMRLHNTYVYARGKVKRDVALSIRFVPRNPQAASLLTCCY